MNIMNENDAQVDRFKTIKIDVTNRRTGQRSPILISN